ncbi:DUF488 domain-containing protein [Thermobifida cellulosilytica]|uniref:MarR family transcriptional regulator n=1 Tax=Thermobifida cellulosilytica TB100 TaxID=665004 RepID=A0A147KFC2_THECS|nr:DUF488 family protein [Thermobifida cellulosilytica]KUP96006.1 hypothetical protein AC529_14455 [Thermobifida cellulosilytica TB100]
MGTSGDIDVRRVYDGGVRDGSATRGRRVFLVDRVWPRGVRKEELRVDGWVRQVAPSTQLRRWFGHDPARWEGFCARYRAELDEEPEAVEELVREARRGPVTLLCAAADVEHNNAVALRAYLLERLGA